eukprot:5316651-Alexandrium_andersonii.AAC.1
MRLLQVAAGAVAAAAAPLRRSPVWAAARAAVEGHCATPGALRSWQALDRLLHRRAAPAAVTW